VKVTEEEIIGSRQVIEHSGLLAESFERATGAGIFGLAKEGFASQGGIAAALYGLPAIVLSHDGSEDPVFTYANRAAQQLFEYDWDQFLRMPSRLSAEPDLRSDRAEMLRRALEDGYINDYSGVRISASGRRFQIDDAIIWNVVDGSGVQRGQAAIFDRWAYL
jgi:PAS domain-containing protein